MNARPLRRRSLVGRLILLAATWSLAVLVAAGLALSAFFGQATTTRFDDELSETVDGLLAGTSVESGKLAAPAIIDPRSLRAYSGEYWEIASAAPHGPLHALLTSRSLWDHVLAPPPGGADILAKSPGRTLFYDSRGPLKQSLRVAAMQGRLPGVTQPVVFIAAEDRSPIDRAVRTFATTIAVALILLGAGLIAAVVVQVRVGLRPLFALRREVSAVRRGETDRLTGAYPAELEPLASELNALMAHNQEVVERQRTHVGNLAHALKTPLSVILAEAGRDHGSLGELVARQAEAMRQQVDHHLRRARAAARSQGQGERTFVAPVLDELARTLEKIFQDKGLVVHPRAPDGLCYLGERQDLLEIVGNVMENACKWCRKNVRVTAAPLTPGQFTLTVEDDGQGLAAELRQAVIERGARIDESAPGSGLGLSIVDELVRAYGGSLNLGESAFGGLKVELVLPRAEARETVTGAKH
ncbi:MAG TPA: sensor histidine kinase [Caulobacteraceae bacterium]